MKNWSRILLIVISVVVFLWLANSAIHVLLLRDSSLAQSVLPPGSQGFWERIIIICLLSALVYILHVAYKHQKTEETLRRSEAKYATLVERGNDGIIIIQGGLLKFANPKMVDMTGYSLREVLGEPFVEFVSPAYRGLAYENYQKRLSSEDVPSKYEIEILARDGRDIPIEINASRIEHEGKPADMAVVRDITERRQADKALRENEEKYRALFENARDGIVLYDAETGAVVDCNREFERETGRQLAELSGLKMWELRPPHQVEPARHLFYEINQHGQAGPIESAYQRPDGHVVPVEYSAELITVQGRPYVQSIARDITKRKEREERIVHLGNILRAVRNVNQLITHEKDRGRLIQKSCELLVERHGYERSWILLLDGDRNPVSVASAGFGEEVSVFIERLKTGNYTECLKELQSQEKPFLASDRPGSRHQGCPLAGAHSRHSVFRCRLEYEGKLRGILGVSISPEAASDQEEQELFVELCGDIAFALAKLENEERRAQAEAEARRLKEHLQLQIDRMPIGLIVWDKEFRVQSWNPSAERMFGFTAKEALGKHAYDIIVPKEAQPQVGSIWGRLLEGDATAHSTNENITKGGRTIICRWANTPLKSAEGAVVGVLSMVEDVTEQTAAEKKLRESEQRFKAVFDYATDGLLVAELQSGRFHMANPTVCQMLGYTLEEVQHLGITDIHPEEALPHVMGEFNRQACREITLTQDIPVKRKDGSVFYADISSAPLTLAGQAYVLGSFRDVTERKRMQEQLIITDRLASVGELASGIAHELNNPLTGIIGLSQLALGRVADGEVKEDLKLVCSEAQRAATVVKGLLSFARKHPTARLPVDVNASIEKVLALRAYEQKVSNIQVIAHFSPDLPEVVADDFQLQQVFLNIIINAEHFMLEAHNQGKLTITTERAGDMVRASFGDDGPGIAKEHLGHIFDPFFTTKEVGKGTGLGLSICHGIVAAHGGRIFAKSEPGQGATFIVELPVGREEEAT